MIRIFILFCSFLLAYWVGWKMGREPKTSFWRQMEFWPDGGTWRCNSCARQVMFKTSNPKDEHLYYCPGCGAKMEKGVK
jgi:PHP family Zn ribbon phosphoesterase